MLGAGAGGEGGAPPGSVQHMCRVGVGVSAGPVLGGKTAPPSVVKGAARRLCGGPECA